MADAPGPFHVPTPIKNPPAERAVMPLAEPLSSPVISAPVHPPIPEIIDPNISRDEVQVVAAVMSSSFKGPIPPPDLLREYNDIIPHGAERIMRMAEESLDHRRSMESEGAALERERLAAQREDARADRIERRIGQIGGFFLGLVGLGIMAFLIHDGHPVGGSVVGVGGIGSLVGTYMYGKNKSEEEPPPKENGASDESRDDEKPAE